LPPSPPLTDVHRTHLEAVAEPPDQILKYARLMDLRPCGWRYLRSEIRGLRCFHQTSATSTTAAITAAVESAAAIPGYGSGGAITSIAAVG